MSAATAKAPRPQLVEPLTFAVYLGVVPQRETISAFTRRSALIQAKQRYGNAANVVQKASET